MNTPKRSYRGENSNACTIARAYIMALAKQQQDAQNLSAADLNYISQALAALPSSETIVCSVNMEPLTQSDTAARFFCWLLQSFESIQSSQAAAVQACTRVGRGGEEDLVNATAVTLRSIATMLADLCASVPGSQFQRQSNGLLPSTTAASTSPVTWSGIGILVAIIVGVAVLGAILGIVLASFSQNKSDLAPKAIDPRKKLYQMTNAAIMAAA